MFRPTSAVLSLILFYFVVTTANAETATGSVRGRVSSEGTKSYLQGADVAITALRLSAYTDREGEFMLVGVPVGTHQLRVNYTGFSTRTVAVTGSPGTTARLDVEMGSEVQQLQAFLLRSKHRYPSFKLQQNGLGERPHLHSFCS